MANSIIMQVIGLLRILANLIFEQYGLDVHHRRYEALCYTTNAVLLSHCAE